MADFRNRNIRIATVSRTDMSIDQGLRSYMLGVYNLMAIGLAITAIAAMAMAWFSFNNMAFAQVVYGSPLRFIIMFSPLIAVLFLSFKIQNLSTSAARTLFIFYAALVGISLSSVFLLYTSASIAQTFFIAAASFGALSLYGYTTKRDLQPVGSFLFVGIIGLLIASVLNIFLASGSLQLVISVIGVFIFAGLTAYDTQAIKEMYYEGDSSDAKGRKIIMGALKLYLDFINMFVFLLHFVGDRD
ncbi:MAG: putative membrane protein [Candidatus Tokpelaia sp. JSC085]|nr:MAG: putative membrane protein [Candidatus Tokpelaia sp. JSC085]